MPDLYNDLIKIDACFTLFFERCDQIASDAENDDLLDVINLIKNDYGDYFLPLLNQSKRVVEKESDTTFEDLYWYFQRT